MEQNNKSKFMEIYANLPMGLRREIISVIDGEPISWYVAYIEIKKETVLGEKILNNLIRLGFI